MTTINLEELKTRLIDSAENWLNEVDTRREAFSAIEQLQRELEDARRAMDFAYICLEEHHLFHQLAADGELYKQSETAQRNIDAREAIDAARSKQG